MFSTFRRYFEESGHTVQEIAEDLSRVGSEYYAIEEDEKPGMETFLYRWKVIGAGVLTPVLLRLLSSSEVPSDQIEKGILALESFIVRRLICRMTTKGQNRLFIDLLPRLKGPKIERAGDVIVEYLAEQKSNTGLWPNDDDLLHAFNSQKLYGPVAQKRIRMILEALEKELRTNKAETQEVPTGLTIEHIMPQGWDNGNWKFPRDVNDETRSRMDRNRLIHTIGNLTLTNNRLNTSLSNRPWNEKRAELREHTTLFLNKDLLDNAIDVWDEEAIRTRALKLWGTALSVWPYADSI